MTDIATKEEWRVLGTCRRDNHTDQASLREHDERIRVLAIIRRRFINTIGQHSYNRIVAPSIKLLFHMSGELNVPLPEVARSSLCVLTEQRAGSTKAISMLGCYEAIVFGHLETDAPT